MMVTQASEGMHYEGNCIRPPPEAYSILLQVTLGCSHNKCTFCGTYKGKPFKIKDEDVILSDILFAATHMRNQDRLFLMDGDALILPQKKLVWILGLIRDHLPWVRGVASYANTKSIQLKTPREMRRLREYGLDRLYLGVESGDDDTRSNVRKGSSARQCLEMGMKVKQTGMRLVTLVLLGIAGAKNSLTHARATGRLLSAMDPDHVSALTILPIPGTPFFDSWQRGDITLPDERGFLMEMREMITHTDLSRGVFASNHASNYLPVRIQYPHGKQKALHIIDAALKGEIGLKPEWLRAF